MITFLTALTLLSHPEPDGPHPEGQWWSIDFWGLEIGQPICADTTQASIACQFDVIDQSDIDRLHQDTVSKGAGDDDYYYEFQNGELTIYSQAEARNSFVCCDIQGPFNETSTSSGERLSAARFRLPEGSIIELMLLNDVTLHGSTTVGQASSPYWRAFHERGDVGPFETRSLSVDGFDRSVEIYSHRPDQPTDIVFYLKDGLALPFLEGLRAYYGDQWNNLPNFALVGIESGDVQTRSDEYLSQLTEDQEAYTRYRTIFSERIAPQVGNTLNFQGDAARRVLVGQSNGAKWVLDYGLDTPNFASHIIAMSPAGRNLSAPSLSDEAYEGFEIFMSVGALEIETFITGARFNRDLLREHGVKITYAELPGGHSFSSWGPFFIEAFDQIVTPKPTTSN